MTCSSLCKSYKLSQSAISPRCQSAISMSTALRFHPLPNLDPVLFHSVCVKREEEWSHFVILLSDYPFHDVHLFDKGYWRDRRQKEHVSNTVWSCTRERPNTYTGWNKENDTSVTILNSLKSF